MTATYDLIETLLGSLVAMLDGRPRLLVRPGRPLVRATLEGSRLTLSSAGVVSPGATFVVELDQRWRAARLVRWTNGAAVVEDKDMSEADAARFLDTWLSHLQGDGYRLRDPSGAGDA